MSHTITSALALAGLMLFSSDADAQKKLAPGPSDNAYMTYKNPKDWLIEGRYLIFPDIRVNALTINGPPYAALQVAIPFVRSTGHAWSDPTDTEFPAVWAAGGGMMTVRAATVPGSQAPYAILTAAEMIETESLQFSIDNVLITSETEFNQKAAWDLPWPERFPPEAASWLTRDPVFDTDSEADGDLVAKLLNEWTGGNDPRQIPPVQLAKFLTGKVLEHVRTNVNNARPPLATPPVSRLGLNRPRLTYQGRTAAVTRGMVGGLMVKNAADIVTDPVGSEHDLTNLLTAMLRRVGIPARTVIGVDKRETGINNRYKSWVEFAMVAPDVDRVIWVPVDVVELKGSGRNSRNWQQEWEHFGTSDELRETVPVAFHFHPPANYRSYVLPSLYGIRHDTELPAIGLQAFSYDINSVPNRGGN
jgi:hypothetical protein